MIKQKFLVHFGSNFIIQILTMIAGLVVARVAGPQVVGVISYGTAYVGIWLFITGTFGSGHIKLISEGQDIGRCIKVYSRIFYCSLILYFITVSGFFIIQKYVLRVGFESKTQEIVVILSLLIAVLSKYYEYNNTTFTATMEQAKANLPDLIKGIAWQISRIVVVILGFRAIGLTAWNAIITLLFIPLVWKLLKKYPGTVWDQQLFRKYVSYAIPIFLIVVIDSIIHYSDKLLLAHFTNATELGYFSAANTIGGMITLASSSIGFIFFPLFSSLIAKKKWEVVRQKIIQYQELLSLFVFPLVCAVILISKPLLTTVLGAKYGPSVVPFMIIALASYVIIVGMPYGNIISGAGLFYLGVRINLIKLAVFIPSIVFFVSPKFLNLGAVGVAMNLLIVNISYNYFYLFYARQISGYSFFHGRNIARYVLASVVAMVFYERHNILANWFSLWWIVAVPAYLSIVYGVMWIFGLMKKEYIKNIMEIVSPRKILNYVKNELGN